MNYEIYFGATNTKGEVVSEITFTAGPFYPDKVKIDKNNLALQRFCVEYARLIGIKCSFAEIYSMMRIK